jgi:hypothetical protein
MPGEGGGVGAEGEGGGAGGEGGGVGGTGVGGLGGGTGIISRQKQVEPLHVSSSMFIRQGAPSRLQLFRASSIRFAQQFGSPSTLQEGVQPGVPPLSGMTQSDLQHTSCLS